MNRHSGAARGTPWGSAIGVLVSLAALLPGAAGGQQASPYAGMTQREIKALSEQQIRELEAGDGMGFALAAELNRYPGPRHVLELADSLALSRAQLAAVRDAERAMRARAQELGSRGAPHGHATVDRGAAASLPVAARVCRGPSPPALSVSAVSCPRSCAAAGAHVTSAGSPL